MKQYLSQALLLILMAVLSVHSFAAAEQKDQKQSPDEVVREVTDKLMSLARDQNTSLKDHPDKYFAEVRVALEPVVSFGYIAKNVMASYWSGATPEQRKNFAETFTESMVETLGKGLANFSDLKVNTLKPKGDIANQKRVEIMQEVQGPDGTNRVSYTMAHSSDGDWKLINVVLNGVNLGKSFRDQFVQSMRQNDNNIDSVISNWAKQS